MNQLLKRLQWLGRKAYGSMVYSFVLLTRYLRCLLLLLRLLLPLLLLPPLLAPFLVWTPQDPNPSVPHCSSWEDTSNDTEKPTCRQGPMAELVSCSHCSANHGAFAARPLVGRLVWRTVRTVQYSSPSDDALWTYPDLYSDALAIWKPCPRLTVLVTSAPERRRQREAIRGTWGKASQYPNCTVRVIFFMSLTQQERYHYAIKAEHLKNKDIVAQAKSLVLREPASSMAALLTEWVPSHANGSQLVLRVTDDTYVDVPALLATMDAWTGAPSAPYLIGRVSRDRRHLESCAYMAKPQVFQCLQAAFADESLSVQEGPLLTGRLATKAGGALLHAEWIGPCDDGSVARRFAHLAAGNSPLEHVTMPHLSPDVMVDIHRSVWRK